MNFEKYFYWTKSIVVKKNDNAILPQFYVWRYI